MLQPNRLAGQHVTAALLSINHGAADADPGENADLASGCQPTRKR